MWGVQLTHVVAGTGTYYAQHAHFFSIYLVVFAIN